MARLLVGSLCLLLLVAVPAQATTPLSVEPLTIQPTDLVKQRLSALNATIPRCNETGEVMPLTFTASIAGVPAARMEASLELWLGPTIGRPDHLINAVQKVRGTLETGQNGQRIAWRVVEQSGGPFSPRIVNTAQKLVFVLPLRMESAALREPVFAVLGVKCNASDGGFTCSEGNVLFERAFPKIFRSPHGTERLFAAGLRDKVRQAAADFAQTRAKARQVQPDSNHSPFLDCCIGQWYCACQDCEEGSGGQCYVLCDTCLVDYCFDCPWAECLAC